MQELVIYIGGFLLTLIGAAFVGSRLNEGKHRKHEIREKNQQVIDLTNWLKYNDRVSKKQGKELLKIHNIDESAAGELLSQYPKVSKNPPPRKARKKKNNRKKLPRG